VRARIAIAVLVMGCMVGLASGQRVSQASDQPAPLTNSDVVQMVRAGFGIHTIFLEIKSSPNKFDTSPRALIRLKHERVSEQIIDAMVQAAQRKSAAEAGASAGGVSGAEASGIETSKGAAPAAAAKQLTGGEMVAKALDAIGPHDKLIAIHTLRWTGSAKQNAATQAGVTLSFVEEGVREYPGLAYYGVQEPSGKWEKVVVTPEFAYRDSRAMTIAVPQARAEQYRAEMKFDPIYIAQHATDFIFTAAGTETKGPDGLDVVQISADGMNYAWTIDAKTGELIKATHEVPAGEVTVEYSDYRKVDGLMLPFKRRTVTPDGITEVSVDGYQVNPDVDGAMFLQPSSLSSAAESLKVLASDSIQVSQGLDGWNSANCQLSVSPGPTNFPNTLDDVAFTQAQPGANMKLFCNSWEQSTIIPRTLNAMLVVSSDGNAYVIACDKAWHWSKCAPLDQGRMYHGSHTSDGFDVDGFNVDGKEVQAHYRVLMMKALQ
jgi:hypothetical protein